MSDELLWGRMAFAGVFAALIVWLVIAPNRFFVDSPNDTMANSAWWKSTRLWAVLVAGFEMMTYLLWG
jgi:hypothetical protein